MPLFGSKKKSENEKEPKSVNHYLFIKSKIVDLELKIKEEETKLKLCLGENLEEEAKECTKRIDRFRWQIRDFEVILGSPDDHYDEMMQK